MIMESLMSDTAIMVLESRLSSRRYHRVLPFIAAIFCMVLILSGVPTTNAQNDTIHAGNICLASSDSKNSSGLIDFEINSWARRGECVRKGNEFQCQLNLQATLDDLSSLRDKEYGAAASVLSLLPTIGALLGAPTNEIWKFKTIVPFGGALAMALSFGGAILPVKVEDYEDAVDRKDMTIGRISSMTSSFIPDQPEQKLLLLVDRIRRRLGQRESARLPKHYLWTGLVAMGLLLGAAQGAMAAVELGGIVSYWCEMKWWMHFWDIFVTLTAVIENSVQVPFIKSHKLYVSTIPYDVSTIGGERITKQFEGEAIDNVAVALKQLGTPRAARVVVHGSQEFTRSRNSVMIMVSVVGDTNWKKVARLFSKSFSIAVYVTGTAIFASVTLLSLKIAIMVLTLNLVAGIFRRATASWVTGRVSSTEPLIHMIVKTNTEAYMAINDVLSLELEDGKLFQTEIEGHIFVNELRVAKRSSLYVAVLGVMAEPYDLRKTQNSTPLSTETEMPFLGTESTSASARSEEKVTRINVRSQSLARDDDVIPRKPVGSYRGTLSNE